jgi:antitoxin component YwqK of YwqJK toxin-antitoxin module
MKKKLSMTRTAFFYVNLQAMTKYVDLQNRYYHRTIREVTILSLLLLLISQITPAQNAVRDTLNRTDTQGRKQGYWEKYDSRGILLYRGYFVNGRPAGEFRRYFDNGKVKSLLYYHPASDTVDVTFFYMNGKKAATGQYVNKKKNGEWRYFSYYHDSLSYLENYRNDLKEGPSIKFYPSGDTAEIIDFKANKKNGRWIQYYPGGQVKLTATYVNDKLEGKFSMYYPDGKNQLQGTYHYDVRQGKWYLFNKKGILVQSISYTDGIPDNLEELTREQSALLDSLEKNKGKFLDPEKYGIQIFKK